MLVKDKIEKAISLSHHIYSAKYARIDIDSGILTIKNTQWISDDHCGLKDVKYIIQDGALYITAIKTLWVWIGWGGPVNWGSNLYQVSKSRIENLIIPDGCLIKNKRIGILRRKKPFLLDVSKNPNDCWFERNDQKETNIVMEPYKIIEP